MFAGDVSAQLLFRDGYNLDMSKSGVFGLIGLTLHGPYYYAAFSQLERMTSTSVSRTYSALAKTALAQFIVFPAYLPVFFTYYRCLRGDEKLDVAEKSVKAYKAGCVFWPTVNYFGFMYIAKQHRIAYLACTGLVWNTFLSLVTTEQG